VRRFKAEPKAVAAAVASQAARAADLGAAAIIAPHGLHQDLRNGLNEAEVEFGDAETSGLSQPLTLVDVAQCKGLEFDAVVLVEPARIVDEGGLRLLFVAVTRAMRTLAIVHSGDLPDVLEP
jgi:superfamily I DNA/RNA helicase